MRPDILEWLRKSDYPLELRIGNLLRDAGWSVTHAHWYTDPETSKPRELDIYARISDTSGEFDPSMQVSLAVECKSSTDKPWVVFTAPQKRFRFLLDNAMVADAVSQEMLWRSRGQKVTRPSLLRSRLGIAHGIVKAHGTDKAGDPTGPYSALKAVVTAAAAIGASNEKFLVEEEESPDYGHIILPVVVLEGDLFEFRLEADGSEVLEPIEAVEVTVPVDPGRSVNVTVVRSTAFGDAYCAGVPDIIAFCNTLRPHVAGLAEHFRQKHRRGGPHT